MPFTDEDLKNTATLQRAISRMIGADIMPLGFMERKIGEILLDLDAQIRTRLPWKHRLVDALILRLLPEVCLRGVLQLLNDTQNPVMQSEAKAMIDRILRKFKPGETEKVSPPLRVAICNLAQETGQQTVAKLFCPVHLPAEPQTSGRHSGDDRSEFTGGMAILSPGL